MIYCDREQRPINKIRRIDAIGGNNVEMANKVVYKIMLITIS